VDTVIEHLGKVTERLAAIEAALDRLTQQKSVKEWYSTSEAGRLLGKAEYTIREYWRLKRVNARKRSCGRGLSAEWMIAHAELQRIQNEGLLPPR
jgi:hypothetical protein